ncbi:hypothetical protein EJB05_46221, partial [Eragrostis curvula]
MGMGFTREMAIRNDPSVDNWSASGRVLHVHEDDDDILENWDADNIGGSSNRSPDFDDSVDEEFLKEMSHDEKVKSLVGMGFSEAIPRMAVTRCDGRPRSVGRCLVSQAIGPPFFYYENVALAPKGVWAEMSRFLYDIEPEYVDSKFFCACARKRGYIHNLPIEKRSPLHPLPPMTISEAFPSSKKFWPPWDTRKQFNCLQTCVASAKLTEGIRCTLANSECLCLRDQKDVLLQCRRWNLLWVGKNKVAPLEPHEMEMLLGFPKDHTRGISRTERYRSLGNSFQVDTVAYHLSVLKDMFPHGINVLSLFSGIGGAEVALHRLGIHMKTVVSVEKADANRAVLRSWWDQTQTGTLIEIADVQRRSNCSRVVPLHTKDQKAVATMLGTSRQGRRSSRPSWWCLAARSEKRQAVAAVLGAWLQGHGGRREGGQ